MEEDLQLLKDFRIAMSELTLMGTVLTSLVEVQNSTFMRVSITIDNVNYQADNDDQMLATIQLRNQILN